MEKTEVEKLADELIYRRYLMNKESMRELFQKVTIPEYVALQMIASEKELDTIYSGRTYLKDLADNMQLTIRRTSKMVDALKNRGLVLWSHDGDGRDGTYVMLTEAGKKLIHDQKESFNRFYSRVFEHFGKQNLIELLRLMRQLETVMSSELEECEEGTEHAGIVE